MFISSSIVSYINTGAADITIVRYIQYMLTISLGLLLSSQYDLDDVCETFFKTSLVIITAHFLLYPFLAGQIAYDPLDRETLLGVTSYGGLFPHKSAAATVFSLSFIVSLVRFLGSSDAARRRSSIILACGSVIAIIMAGAVGRLWSLAIGVFASLLLRALIRGDMTRLFMITGAALLGAIALVSIGADSLLSSFGRSADLTGRQDLFELWPRFFLERPLFGYGYDGFFTGVIGAPADYLSGIIPGHGTYGTFESSYLDILIQFGIVGGSLFGCILFAALWRSMQIYRTSVSKYKFVPLFIIIWTLAGSLSDSGLLTENFIICVLVFWIYFGVSHPSGYRRSAPDRFVPALLRGRLRNVDRQDPQS